MNSAIFCYEPVMVPVLHLTSNVCKNPKIFTVIAKNKVYLCQCNWYSLPIGYRKQGNVFGILVVNIRNRKYPWKLQKADLDWRSETFRPSVFLKLIYLVSHQIYNIAFLRGVLPQTRHVSWSTYIRFIAPKSIVTLPNRARISRKHLDQLTRILKA